MICFQSVTQLTLSVLTSKNLLGLGMVGGPDQYMIAANFMHNRKVQKCIAICVKFCNGQTTSGPKYHRHVNYKMQYKEHKTGQLSIFKS